jgi:hypothetical protein
VGAWDAVGPLGLALVALGLAVLAAWELRLWHVRRGVRAGRVALVTCARCRRRVPDAWPLINASKTCAVCVRARPAGSWQGTRAAGTPALRR